MKTALYLAALMVLSLLPYIADTVTARMRKKKDPDYVFDRLKGFDMTLTPVVCYCLLLAVPLLRLAFADPGNIALLAEIHNHARYGAVFFLALNFFNLLVARNNYKKSLGGPGEESCRRLMKRFKLHGLASVLATAALFIVMPIIINQL